MINNLGTSSSELQINFGVLQIDTKYSATGIMNRPWSSLKPPGMIRLNKFIIFINQLVK